MKQIHLICSSSHLICSSGNKLRNVKEGEEGGGELSGYGSMELLLKFSQWKNISAVERTQGARQASPQLIVAVDQKKNLIVAGYYYYSIVNKFWFHSTLFYYLLVSNLDYRIILRGKFRVGQREGGVSKTLHVCCIG